MPVLQGLIFDLDGTLMDSAPDLRQALNGTLAAHGRRGLTLEETTRMVGDGMLTLLTRAFAATGTPVNDADSYALFQEFIDHYRNQKPDPAQVYPHTVETLAHYRDRNVKLGVCTNKQEAATIHLLQQLGLAKYFNFVAGGDTFPVHKPHPGHVKGVMDKLGVTAANCVMIGDGPNDVASAQGAGVPCLIVTHGYGGFGQYDANRLIAGFHELSAALHRLGYEVA